MYICVYVYENKGIKTIIKFPFDLIIDIKIFRLTSVKI